MMESGMRATAIGSCSSTMEARSLIGRHTGQLKRLADAHMCTFGTAHVRERQQHSPSF